MIKGKVSGRVLIDVPCSPIRETEDPLFLNARQVQCFFSSFFCFFSFLIIFRTRYSTYVAGRLGLLKVRHTYVVIGLFSDFLELT